MQRISRRRFLGIVGSTVAAAASTAATIYIADKLGWLELFSSDSPIPYAIAQSDESKRQEYLNETARRYGIPELDRTIYDPDKSRLEKYLMDTCKTVVYEIDVDCEYEVSQVANDSGYRNAPVQVPGDLSILGTETRAPVFVHSSAFDLMENDFLSLLVDHEFVHVRDFYHGIQIGPYLITYEHVTAQNKPVVEDMLEIRAYSNQLFEHMMGNRQMTTGFKKETEMHVYDYFNRLYQRLYNPSDAGSENFEKLVIKEQLRQTGNLEILRLPKL